MIYLDSAATSLMKPPEVGNAMHRALSQCASPGRGSHASALRAAETVYACREEAARLFHADDVSDVVLTMNATHALNLAIASVVSPGDRVVTSGYEHNAVTRPLNAVHAETVAGSVKLFDRDSVLRHFARELPTADAAVCTQVSNVFGWILPVGEIAELCRKYGVPLILDASQSAGVLDIDFSALKCAFIAMPGHKGLLGPQGTGLLLCGHPTKPLLFGGTGGMSRDQTMPEELPERLEAGTQNVCGAAGLTEGLRYVRRMTPAALKRKEDRLLTRLTELLLSCDGLEVFHSVSDEQCSVVSVRPKHMSCELLAESLAKLGVAVRAGLHCAPQAHCSAGTLDTGTVRFSVSPFNTVREIETVAMLTKKILKNSYKM